MKTFSITMPKLATPTKELSHLENVRESRIQHKFFSRELCELFGGFTVSKATGSWVNPLNARLEVEKVLIYRVAYPDNVQSGVKDLALGFAENMRQHSVYFEANGAAHILELD